MTLNLFKKILKSSLAVNQIDLPEITQDQITEIWASAVKWNALTSLTSNISAESFVRENVMDPLKALESWKNSTFFKSCPQTLADFGCGGGFVGLIWALIRSDFEVTLIDNNRKKISFINDVIRVLDLKNTKAIRYNLKDKPNASLSHSFHGIMTRATWPWDEFVALASPFIRPMGQILGFQGPQARLLPPAAELHYELQPNGLKRRLFIVSQS